MTRYIDAEELYKILNQRNMLETYKDYMAVNGAINDTPTADVVPKSEVEKLERILNCYALQYGTVTEQQEVIDKAKAEVAREIFEEIKEIIQNRKNEEIKRQEQCGNGMMSPFTYSLGALEIMEFQFDELKKRYTKNVEVVRDLAGYAVDQDIQNYKENK